MTGAQKFYLPGFSRAPIFHKLAAQKGRAGQSIRSAGNDRISSYQPGAKSTRIHTRAQTLQGWDKPPRLKGSPEHLTPRSLCNTAMQPAEYLQESLNEHFCNNLPWEFEALLTCGW